MPNPKRTSTAEWLLVVLLVITLVLAALKLIGFIALSWAWVTSPFWGLFALVFVLVALSTVLGPLVKKLRA
jgi:ABC-type sugar transport system permease subunit